MTNSVRYLVETVEWSSSAPWKISRRCRQGGLEVVVVAAGAHARVQYVVGEGAPAVEAGGVDPEVAEGPDVAHGVAFRR